MKSPVELFKPMILPMIVAPACLAVSGMKETDIRIAMVYSMIITTLKLFAHLSKEMPQMESSEELFSASYGRLNGQEDDDEVVQVFRPIKVNRSTTLIEKVKTYYSTTIARTVFLGICHARQMSPLNTMTTLAIVDFSTECGFEDLNLQSNFVRTLGTVGLSYLGAKHFQIMDPTMAIKYAFLFTRFMTTPELSKEDEENKFHKYKVALNDKIGSLAVLTSLICYSLYKKEMVAQEIVNGAGTTFLAFTAILWPQIALSSLHHKARHI